MERPNLIVCPRQKIIWQEKTFEWLEIELIKVPTSILRPPWLKL